MSSKQNSSQNTLEFLEWQNFVSLVESLKNTEDPEISYYARKVAKRIRRDKWIINPVLQIIKYVLLHERVHFKEKIIEREIKERIVEREVKIDKKAIKIKKGELIHHPRGVWYAWKLMRTYDEFVFSVRYGLPKAKVDILHHCLKSVLYQIAERTRILTTQELHIIFDEIEEYKKTKSNRKLAPLNDHIRELAKRLMGVG